MNSLQIAVVTYDWNAALLPNDCLFRTIPNNVRTLFGNEIAEIGGAADAATALIQHVSINHCRANVLVA
jgi:hypothetical protein